MQITTRHTTAATRHNRSAQNPQAKAQTITTPELVDQAAMAHLRAFAFNAGRCEVKDIIAEFVEYQVNSCLKDYELLLLFVSRAQARFAARQPLSK
jgi:hypothetical protein